ncbi:MAG: hypothetical protein QXQ46_09000 [Thermoplasmatales archaeon]
MGILLYSQKIGIREIVDSTLGHRYNGLSPSDYVLIFTMNRFSDPRSK